MYRSDRVRMRAWLWCLFGTAVALIAACELVYLRDVFASGDHGALGIDFRMNTVFKLYYQAWLLLGIVAGPALFWLLARGYRLLRASLTGVTLQNAHAGVSNATSGALVSQSRTGSVSISPLAPVDTVARLAAIIPPSDSLPPGTDDTVVTSIRRDSRRTGPDALRLLTAGGIVCWMVVCVALMGAAAIYPVLATSARTANFTLARTLDGTAYMATDAINQGDAQAIAWINANIGGDPVIVEGARYDEYTHYGRISAFTGLPTLLGWGGHEVQWRYNWLQQPGRGDVIGQRLDAITQIYTNADSQQVLALLREYSARYVYVGTAEHQLYPSANLERFATFLRVVYRSADVTIYAVP